MLLRPRGEEWQHTDWNLFRVSVGPLSPSPYMVGLELKPTQSDSQTRACAMTTMALRSLWETLHLIPSHSCHLDVSFLYR